MSQPLSPSRLSYSRDFLLKYQHIYTPDPQIIALINPYLSPPRSTQTKRRPNSGKKKTKQDNQDDEGTTPLRISKTPRRKLQNEKIAQQTIPAKKTPSRDLGPNPVPFTQKENIEFIPNSNNFYKPIQNSVPVSSSPSSLSSVLQPRTPGLHDALPSPLPLATKSTANKQVYFYESKFASLFHQSQVDPAMELSPELLELKKLFDIKDDDSSSISKLEHLPLFNFMTDIKPSRPDPETSVGVSSMLYPVSSPKSDPFSGMMSPDANLLSSWSLVDTKRTTSKTSSICPASPEGTLYKAVTTPYRSSRTPHKSPHHGIPSGRPISPLDEQRLVQRQKQIDYGYRTVGYLRYRLLVPKEKRKPEHPRTPKKAQGCSKRSWDGQLKKWRRDLHLWDPDSMEAFKALLNSDLVESIIVGNPELAEIVRVVRDKLENPAPLDDGDDDSASEQDSPNDLKAMVGSSPVISTADSICKNSSEPRLDRVARTLVF